ncbi:MAG: sulfatase-like hydrolase/transferase [Phenylobacterium sp.]|uniref:sulfatase-like hydrolase/transferase n=1 Tax=Phenylobacterium sp. TaxID=1871053 RepID=UPI002720841F|nr:sulfatase-like hydrolase/transferase [Phenylobacterium sp.]MDO9430189.1 sulfatase-like hydrolase/transferase [Phenylobacterium sp.]
MNRKLAWALGTVVVIVVAGVIAFQHFWIYIPGVVGRIKNPIQPFHEVTWGAGAAPTLAPGARRPPNVIVIVADDLGINDLQSTGAGVANGAVPTPNIDSLARDGVSFTNGYAGNATCSPSRAAMMTGRYPTRFGFEFTSVPVAFARNIKRIGGHGPIKPIFYEDRVAAMPPVEDLGVPASEVTLAETMKSAGYRTLHIGKWHLGEAEGLRPEDQGFDDTLNILAGGGMFLPANDPNVVNSKQDFDAIDKFLWANLPFSVRFNGSKPFHPRNYITDYFGDEAVSAIRANKDRPFFMYLAFNAPHTPLQALKSDYDALPQIRDHRLRVYAAMIAALDRNVGKVLAELKAQGLEGDTIVIFTSDNGGANYIGLPDINKPYRGFKATFFEGGVRVPMFMRWPGQVPAGSTTPVRAMHFDIFATAAAAANAPPAKPGVLDGVDLRILASGKASDRPLFFRSGHYRVVINGDWKLQLSERPKKAWLFNIKADPTEQTNLAAANPAMVAQLTALLDAQDRRAAKPIWPALIEGPIWIDKPVDGTPMPKDAEYVMWAN